MPAAVGGRQQDDIPTVGATDRARDRKAQPTTRQFSRDEELDDPVACRRFDAGDVVVDLDAGMRALERHREAMGRFGHGLRAVEAVALSLTI